MNSITQRLVTVAFSVSALALLLLQPIQAQQLTESGFLKAEFPGFLSEYGRSVAVDGTTAAVGAPRDSVVAGVTTGAVYIYDWNGVVWEQTAAIAAEFPGGDDRFGNSVALSGGTLVVGAPWEDSSGVGLSDNGIINSGAAFVYERQGDDWVLHTGLKASHVDSSDLFGWSVDMSGDTIVVGALQEGSFATGVNGYEFDDSMHGAGAAYVFERSGGAWSQSAYLKASNTEADDSFGWSVATSGSIIAVGATREDSNAAGLNGDDSDNSQHTSGAVYVFYKNAGGWEQEVYVKASNSRSPMQFGYSLDIDGESLLIGAPYETSNATGVNGDQFEFGFGAGWTGAAYLLHRTNATWAQETYFKASSVGIFGQNTGNRHFGWSVAIKGGHIAAGAPFDDGLSQGLNGSEANDPAADNDSGAAYLFEYDGVTWAQTDYIKSFNSTPGDQLGWSVSLTGDQLLVGALRQGIEKGAGYMFDLVGPRAKAASRTLGANADSLSSTLPKLGSVWNAQVDLASTGHSLAALMFFAAPTQVGPILNDQWLLVGPNFPSDELFGLAPLAGPLAQLAVPIPNSPSLAGFELFMQAIHFGAVQPLALSNALDLRIGF